jgi:uncharacterized membrane protein
MLGLLRLVYLLWSIGAIVVLARGLSQIFFGRKAPGVQRFSRAVLLALLWPIAVATAEGRAALRALGRSD